MVTKYAFVRPLRMSLREVEFDAAPVNLDRIVFDIINDFNRRYELNLREEDSNEFYTIYAQGNLPPHMFGPVGDCVKQGTARLTINNRPRDGKLLLTMMYELHQDTRVQAIAMMRVPTLTCNFTWDIKQRKLTRGS